MPARPEAKSSLIRNRHRRGLSTGEVKTPDITGLLKHDRVLPDGGKLDVEILEARKLFRLLAREIGREKIHPTVAIGDVIDTVVGAPHRANVLRRIVRQVLGRAGLEIEDPDIVRHPAAIVLPGAELAKDAVERHFRVVRREGGEAAARDRQRLRQLGVHPHDEEVAVKRVVGFHPRAEHDGRLRVLPGQHDVVWAHAIADVVARERGRGGEAFRRPAFRRHNIDFRVAVVLRSEGELRAIRGKARERAVTRAARNAPRHATLFRHGVKRACIGEDDLRPVRGRET